MTRVLESRANQPHVTKTGGMAHVESRRVAVSGSGPRPAEPEQPSPPISRRETVTAANFSIHYPDSQEQDLKMTSSWRGKFKFSRK